MASKLGQGRRHLLECLQLHPDLAAPRVSLRRQLAFPCIPQGPDSIVRGLDVGELMGNNLLQRRS